MEKAFGKQSEKKLCFFFFMLSLTWKCLNKDLFKSLDDLAENGVQDCLTRGFDVD